MLFHFRFLPEVLIFGSNLDGKAYRAQSQAQPVVQTQIECFLARLNNPCGLSLFCPIKVCSSLKSRTRTFSLFHSFMTAVLNSKKRQKRKKHNFKKLKDKRQTLKYDSPPWFTFERGSLKNLVLYLEKNSLDNCSLLKFNRPLARSSHVARNKLHWDAKNAVGLPKQRNSYQSNQTLLCFESPTALFASQHNLFHSM